MKRKVRKKPEKDPKEEVIVQPVDKEKKLSDREVKKKMTPIEKERLGMNTTESKDMMHPLS